MMADWEFLFCRLSAIQNWQKKVIGSVPVLENAIKMPSEATFLKGGKK